jgi:DNA-binding CsgD family transcriptional regulator
MEVSRKIPPRMETAYRLCSHHFEGRTIEAAAVKMGVSVHAVQNLLRRMEKLAPQLFPILSPVERAVLTLLEAHAKRNEIAAGLSIDPQTVDRIISKLKAMGEIKNGRKPVSYSTRMDGKVAERF